MYYNEKSNSAEITDVSFEHAHNKFASNTTKHTLGEDYLSTECCNEKSYGNGQIDDFLEHVIMSNNIAC